MRSTRTNSGVDSKGVVRFGRWELEGEAYLYVVVGALLAILTFVLAFRLPMGWRLVLASLPLLGAMGWVKFFLVNRPPHFLGDFLEGVLVGRHFNLSPQAWARQRHPLSHRGLRICREEAGDDR
jgi:hypothetical protein